MLINKRIALSAVICNFIYSTLCVARFLYTHSQIIIDVYKGAPLELPQNSLWYTIPQILYLLIFTSLFWLLKVFYERVWIAWGIVVFIVIKLATLTIIHLTNTQFLIDQAFILTIINIVNFVTLIYVTITFFLVRNEFIRPYFRWFSILLVMSVLLPRLGEILYDDFSVHWLLINGETISQASFLLTLILFIRIFLLSMNTDNQSVKALTK